MTRFTKEDGEKFMEEEERRNAEETAAYFAWKRGETPLGETPKYIPPNPSPEPSQPSPSESPPSSSDPEMKHLFDDPLFDEDGDLRSTEKVDIDSVDIDDLSPLGREKRMRAMADELSGFSAGQRREAEEAEKERALEGGRVGRGGRDECGQGFGE